MISITVFSLRCLGGVRFHRASRAMIGLALVGLGAGLGQAQGTATPESPAGESVLELSPFVVREGSDIGYVGAQSLLGSRFKQELRDIPAQIEVFTPEFLLDFDLTRAEDAFKYSASVENYQEFVSPTDGGNAVWSSQTSGRVRGLQPASFSVARELFSGITTADSYNLDRVELASGAQSLLFSLGEPAGLANMSLKRAQWRDFGQVTMRVDTESGYRGVLDLNRQLVPRLLAMRLALVQENRPQFIKPSHDRNTRLYGTLTLQPWRGTTLRVHVEGVKEDSNRPVTHLPFDWATPFFVARQNGTLSSLVTEGNGSVQQSPTLIWGANAAPISYLHWRLQERLTAPGRLPFDPAQYGNAFDPNSGVERITFNPDNIGLIPEVAASIGRNFLGESARNRLDSRQLDFFLEQRLAENLRLELGGHHETWDKRLEQLALYNQYGYYVDVNRYIPIVPWLSSTQAPNFSQNLPINASYMLNPNYGKIYHHAMPQFTWTLRDTAEYRASLAWEPDLRRRHPWLGRHSFLGAIATRTSSAKSQSSTPKLMNPRAAYQGLSNFSYPDARRALVLQQYFDPQHATLTLPFGDRLTFGEYFTGFDYTEPTTGEVLRFSGWDSPVGARPTGTKSSIDSGILAWQGRLLGDRLQFSYGVRRDDVRSYKLEQDYVGGVGYDPASQGWYWMDRRGWDRDPAISQKKTSRTYGGILRPVRWLSFSYYESSTFSLATGNLTPFGDPVPGVAGNSKDYGVRVDFLGGRLFLKANVYDVTQQGRSIGGYLPIDAQRLENSYYRVVEEKRRTLGTLPYEQLIAQEGFGAGVNGQTSNVGTYPMTGDARSRGLELTGGSRFGHLDVRLSAAKTNAKTGSAAVDWERWVQGRLPFWQKLTDAAGATWDRISYQGTNPENFFITDAVTGQRRVMTMQEFYRNVVVTDLALVQAGIGKPVDTERKYRANLNLAYSFTEGWWRGVRIGGAVIYRSGAILGFPAKPLPAPGQAYPIPVLDLEHPYYGPSDVNLDAFIAYQGRNFFGSRHPWRVQVNGSNLLTGTNSFRTGRVNARGESTFTLIETPRAASATLSFDF